MREVNGTKLWWQSEDDLPGLCCACPWYDDGRTDTSVPGTVSAKGYCRLRNIMKPRYAETPKTCRRFFAGSSKHLTMRNM